MCADRKQVFNRGLGMVGGSNRFGEVHLFPSLFSIIKYPGRSPATAVFAFPSSEGLTGTATFQSRMGNE